LLPVVMFSRCPLIMATSRPSARQRIRKEGHF
jgi:hypothetical protein